MDLYRGLSIGRLDQTEHLSRLVVDPVPLVLHAVLTLFCQVRLVCLGDIRRRGAVGQRFVNIHEERHIESSLNPKRRYGPPRLAPQQRWRGIVDIFELLPGTRRLARWVIAHMSDLDVARRLGPAPDSEDQFLTDLVLTDPLLHGPWAEGDAYLSYQPWRKARPRVPLKTMYISQAGGGPRAITIVSASAPREAKM